MSRRTAAVLAVVALFATALSGCSWSGVPAEGCVPVIVVSPSTVAPGDMITLSSDTPCDVTMPDGGWSIAVAPVGAGDEPLALATTDAPFDGSFEVTVRLPTDFPEGDAFARVDNWDYSFCSGAGSGSCASASGDFTVGR
ncbi:hypothetical protein IF188_13600 [Microbacterium sp. NEAU-LLC]|uniref:Secreted protein n=1 Tax=Microbacterium helvum TaxID=2773713 RepID=A0ABR8NUK0_9MICO|nr:hypothetical protein [Microbacterium helvum]MBD3942731.1 hypothetical protein [Microbacterium helvum]